jgi:hypothetical protein
MTDETTPATDWWGAIRQYGFATALASALLSYIAFYVVEPARKDQQEFMRSVIKTNEINAETHKAAAASMTQLSQVQQTQAATLTTLVDQQKQTTIILQQIRDDQRAGAWRENKSGVTH